MTGTLRVRNLEQKVLWDFELSGQLSDGHWENATPRNHYEPWCRAQVVVDPAHVGTDFWAQRRSYNFTAKDLLDVTGERMLEEVRRATGNGAYSMTDMRRDLNDLKKIIKEHVSSALPVPPQPESWVHERQVSYTHGGRTYTYTVCTVNYTPKPAEVEPVRTFTMADFDPALTS